VFKNILPQRAQALMTQRLRANCPKGQFLVGGPVTTVCGWKGISKWFVTPFLDAFPLCGCRFFSFRFASRTPPFFVASTTVRHNAEGKKKKFVVVKFDLVRRRSMHLATGYPPKSQTLQLS